MYALNSIDVKCEKWNFGDYLTIPCLQNITDTCLM